MKSVVFACVMVGVVGLSSSCMIAFHGRTASHETKKENNRQILEGRILKIGTSSFVFETREKHQYEFKMKRNSKISKNRLFRYRDKKETVSVYFTDDGEARTAFKIRRLSTDVED